MSVFNKSRGALVLAFLAVAATTGCAKNNNDAAATTSSAAVETRAAPCIVTEKINNSSDYYVNRYVDFDKDVVIYKVGYGESGITTTPFSQLTPRAQEKLETLRKTLPANCQ